VYRCISFTAYKMQVCSAGSGEDHQKLPIPGGIQEGCETDRQGEMACRYILHPALVRSIIHFVNDWVKVRSVLNEWVR
jgi:hypothetical protein